MEKYHKISEMLKKNSIWLL